MPEENELEQIVGEAAVETAPVAPAAEPPAPAAPKTAAEMRAAFNEQREAQLEQEEEEIDPDLSILPREPKTPAAETEEEADEQAEEEKPAEDAPAEGEEAHAVAAAPLFEVGKETPETYAAKKAEILGQFEEVPDEIKQLLEFNEQENAALRASVSEIDAIGSKDTIIKTAKAIDEVYADTTIENGKPKYNPLPLITHLRTDHKEVFTDVADQLFQADSVNFPRMSVMEEILVKNFGLEKANAAAAFLQSDMPLPATPPASLLPAVIPAAVKEAYFAMPEVRRFEIQSKAQTLADLEADLEATTEEYYKPELREKIVAARASLEAEIDPLLKAQAGIDSQREATMRAQRQESEGRAALFNQTTTRHMGDMMNLQEDFAKALAPKFDFAAPDTQIVHGRNTTARLANAFSFLIETDGSFIDDPMADVYAKQLKDEGVNYDFTKGRNLLKQHFQAVALLQTLENSKAAKPAIEKADLQHKRIQMAIRTEFNEVLGQISTKLASSAGKALETKVADLAAKKQFARLQPKTKADTRTRDTRSADEQRAAYNKQVAAKTGEELYEQYADQ